MLTRPPLLTGGGEGEGIIMTFLCQSSMRLLETEGKCDEMGKFSLHPLPPPFPPAQTLRFPFHCGGFYDSYQLDLDWGGEKFAHCEPNTYWKQMLTSVQEIFELAKYAKVLLIKNIVEFVFTFFELSGDFFGSRG